MLNIIQLIKYCYSITQFIHNRSSKIDYSLITSRKY